MPITDWASTMTTDRGNDLGTVEFTITWDAATTGNTELDLDISGFSLNARGSVLSDEHFVFFNNATSPDGALRHSTADSATRPSEKLLVNTSGLASGVAQVAIAVTVYGEAADFRRFADARIAAHDSRRGALAEYELTSGTPKARAIVYAKLVKDNGVWRFRAVGEQYGSLKAVASGFGVNLGG